MTTGQHLLLKSLNKAACTVALLIPILFLTTPWVVGREAAAEVFHLAVDDPRPLAKAIEAVEERYGWIITYEDPRSQHASDTEDVTALVRRDAKMSNKVLIPKGGLFTFTYNVPDNIQTPEARFGFLETLVTEYNASGHSGQFHLRRSAGTFQVIPAAVKDKAGNMTQQSALLDTRVTLEEAERSIDQTIRETFRALNKLTGITVQDGITPTHLLAQTRVRDGANSEPARDVLLRALAATERKLSWQLFYDPGMNLYVFNVHIVN